MKDWSNILSLGEQQRLAFGRVLVNKPKFIILDEATSALDIKAEKQMYTLLRQDIEDTTYLSVGHRPSLFDYHDINLHLDGDNGVSMRPIQHSTS